MACGCGGGASTQLAYRVNIAGSDGETRTEYVETRGAYLALKRTLEDTGEAVAKAVVVPRAEMDAWVADQAAGS